LTVSSGPRPNPRPNGWDYLEFIARVTSPIPDKGQVTVRYYGLYTNAHRGKVQKASSRATRWEIDPKSGLRAAADEKQTLIVKEPGKSKLLRKVRRIRRDYLGGLKFPRSP